METVGFSQGGTSMEGLGTGMQHASLPVSQLNDKEIFLNGQRYVLIKMPRDEDKMKIGWKEVSCRLIMGVDYSTLASFEKRDGALGEVAWMAAALAFLITLFGVVVPLKMPRFLFGFTVILTGLSYMAFVAMKFTY
ncbi:hypothetical protein KI387_036860, partial [Taxus chinensis]